LAVLALISVLATVPSALASTPPPPSLPVLTPQQLLTRVQLARPPQALSGAIRLATNLGIPNLSQLAGQSEGPGLDVFSLLSGNHDARVWFDGPQRSRIALLDQLSETDVIRNGRDLWIWQSGGSLVSHRQLDAVQAAGTEPTAPVNTPDQLAKQFLAQVDPSTAVSVQAPVRVAGHPAYQLVLSPRAAGSTIDHVTIAVDSATSVPLRVAVTAKGQTKPAVQLGFTSISFSRPAASTFSFTPPPGSHPSANPFATPAGPLGERAHGRRAGTGSPTATGSPTGTAHEMTVVGKDWTAVLIVRAVSLPGPAGEVLKAATVVPGGRLLQTSLVNVLLLDDGRVAIGAVTPGVLEAAVPSAA
jgi:outer membrane lipoprotein-sorting protein